MTEPTQPGRPAHVAAASGLACVGDRLYTVADDERAIAEFSVPAPASPGRWWPLGGAGLPLDHRERKARKPDLEALVALEDGTLVAFGSGSAATRNVAVTLAPDRADRRSFSAARWEDLTPLYAELAQRIPSLNIEGGFVRGDALWLIQRGNSASGFSALIELQRGGPLTSAAIRAVHPLHLPRLGGVPLTPTDGAILPDGRVVLSASAEDTLDPYSDGTVTGSALVLLTGVSTVDAVLPLDRTVKVEGITVVGDALWMVTDADDVDRPAQLLSVPLAALEESRPHA